MTPRDDLRVGDAERETAMAALREHYTQGRLTYEELDERLGLALSARTGGELALIGADLPGPHASRPAESKDAGNPWRADRPGHRSHGHPRFRPHHHAAWSHHRAGHRGGPPFAPALILLVVAGVAVAGLGVLKFVLLAWLTMAVLGRLRHRRWSSRTGRFTPPGAS